MSAFIYTIGMYSLLVEVIGGLCMEYETIGRNIRRVRTEKKWNQAQLAERAGLSENYIGNIERGEKLPSLETFITLVNALGTSADVLLADVIDVGYQVKNTVYAEKLAGLSPQERARIYDVIDALLRHAR